MEELILIFALIILNGVFSMAEISLISARKSNLSTDANKGSRSAKTALKLQSNPDKFLSSVQIGITTIGILTGMVSGNKISAIFAATLQNWGLSASLSMGLAQALIVVIVTYFTIVLGELVPKRIGMSASEKVAKAMAVPMHYVSVIASPLVWILSKSTSFIVSMLGLKQQDTKVTEEEIKSIIQEGTEEGEISPVEQDIVENVFTLGDLKISTIMTQRNDIVTLDIDMSEAEVRKIVEENVYEVYPVVDGDLDHVMGIISLKDYVLHIGRPDFDLKQMIKTPTYFHENMNVYTVLEEMKKQRINRALVCDEFGSCSGIFSLKDMMDALVGSIDDDSEDPDIVKRQGNEGYLVDGQCPIYDFLRHFDKDEMMQDYEYTTVAGLILEELGRLPVPGDVLTWNDFLFEVVDMDGPRIDKIIVKIKD